MLENQQDCILDNILTKFNNYTKHTANPKKKSKKVQLQPPTLFKTEYQKDTTTNNDSKELDIF